MRRFTLFSLLLLLLPATQLIAKSPVVPLDKIIVIVNDDIITQLELDERVKLISQQIRQQGSRIPPLDTLRQQILERLILEKLQLDMAQKTGIQVNDEMVNRVLSNIAQENRLSLQQFRKVIEKDGYEFSEFRENIRRQIIISRLHKIQVENKVNISEQEIDNYLNQSLEGNSGNDEYHLRHILIATPEAATPEQIEVARVKAEKIVAELKKGDDFAQKAIEVSNDELALKGGDLGWRKTAQLPTFMTSVIRTMRKNDIQGPLRSASGFHIIKLQDKRSDSQQHIINQTMARHILIRPTQVLSSEEARMRLQDIRQRIKNGEDFANLARASSDDKASAAEGGSLNWVSPGTMVPAFEEEMNKLKPGEISEPFMTEFGWHIVQVLSRRKHDNTQQFQRSQAINLIRKRKTEEAIQDWSRRLRAEAYIDYRTNK
ncbi:MAG: peptidylprolyl isomerase [Gammaproteobacteria bacterium]|nr:peptidylprolyl isomerase [Gammaproteobacteria bacterium]MCW8987330.1 peptidylprolyl isomerase [Gammaproteobacteria bacterium]MCW9031988.1 peptidylprolyl isomerase [Gammaproteobacteria bacterium]